MQCSTDEVLDPTTVRHLKELGGDAEPGLFEELLALYLSDGRRRIRELQEALARRDWPILEYACHSLKSGSVNIGANAVAELCHHLELAIREGRESVARNLVGRICVEFTLVQESTQESDGVAG